MQRGLVLPHLRPEERRARGTGAEVEREGDVVLFEERQIGLELRIVGREAEVLAGHFAEDDDLLLPDHLPQRVDGELVLLRQRELDRGNDARRRRSPPARDELRRPAGHGVDVAPLQRGQ